MDTRSNVVTLPKPKKERRPNARVRGQGSLFKRGEMYWFKLNWKGVRTRKSLETDDRETALIKLDAEVAAIRAGELPKTFQPVTCQTMFDGWMVHVENNCKPLTIKDYQSRWNLHLKPYFGGMFATAVTLDTITAYLNKRMKEGAGVVCRNRENRILQMIFGFNESKVPADR